MQLKLICPVCENDKDFLVEVSATVLVVNETTQEDTIGNIEYSENLWCECSKCGYGAIMQKFEKKDWDDSKEVVYAKD